MHQDLERILFDETEIGRGLERVARDIGAHYGERAFVVVPVLRGSILFAADLVRRLSGPLEMAFASARSYGAGTAPGELTLELLPPEEELRGREVLLVDDILDSGQTLVRLRDALIERGARDVRSCVLLDKPARRRTQIAADWRCFEIDDEFVVGYGLDLAGRYRNLPYVGTLRRELLP